MNWLRIAFESLFDIRDFNALQKDVISINPDVVFHLAAQPLVLESYKDPLGTWSTNVMGSLNLLEALKTINKIVLLSW